MDQRALVPEEEASLIKEMSDHYRILVRTRSSTSELNQLSRFVELPWAELHDIHSRDIPLAISALNRQCNEQSLVNQLPNELLTHILALTVDPLDWNRVETKTLCLVCHRWCDIIRNDPLSWRTLAFGVPHLSNPTLARNKTGGLTVCYMETRPQTVETSLAFLKDAAVHASRWDAFMFDGELHEEAMSLLNQTPIPNLRDLLLYSTQGSGPVLQLEQFTSGMPLRTLLLKCVTLDRWTSLPARFSGIETLHISSPQNLPSINSVHNMLTMMQHLRSLDLSCWDIPDDQLATQWEDGNLPIESALFLPDLEVMRLVYIPASLMGHLLKSVQPAKYAALILDPLPPTCNSENILKLGGLPGLLKKSSGLEIFVSFEDLHRAPKLQIATPATEFSPIDYQWCSPNLKRKASGLCIDISVADCDDAWWNEVGSLINDAVPEGLTASLKMHGPVHRNAILGNASPHGSFPVTSLVSYPFVTEMEFMHLSNELEVLQYLDHPLSSDTFGAVWACPRLTSLDFDHSSASKTSDFLPALWRCVKQRNTTAGSVAPIETVYLKMDILDEVDSMFPDLANFVQIVECR